MKKPETKLQRLKRLEAKRRLEKAAPEMLEALLFIRSNLGNRACSDKYKLDVVEEAIRKATKEKGPKG